MEGRGEEYWAGAEEDFSLVDREDRLAERVRCSKYNDVRSKRPFKTPATAYSGTTMKSSLPLAVLFALTGLAQGQARPQARGADVGWLSEMESAQRVFKDRNGKAGDLLDILRDQGVNSIRLRVWVDPAKPWCNKDDVVRMAARAHRKGMALP